MDTSAINKILEQNSTRDLNLEIIKQGLAALPNDCSIHDIQMSNGIRRYFKGDYRTSDLEHFIKYVNDNKAIGSELFIDTDDMAALAVFDIMANNQDGFGTCDHIAVFKAKPTPEFMGIRAITSHHQKFTQRDIVDFAEEFGDVVTFTDTNGDPVEYKKALVSLENMKVTKRAENGSVVARMSETRSTTANIEASGKDITIGGFTCKISLFEDTEPVELTVKFRLHVRDDNFLVTAKILKLESIMREVAEYISNKITASVDIKTYNGTFKAV